MIAPEAVMSVTKLRHDELRDAVKGLYIAKPIRGMHASGQAVSGALAWYRSRLDLPPTITSDELREITGLTDIRHRQLANEGYYPPPIRGRYELRAVFRGFVRYITKHREERETRLTALRERALTNQNEAMEFVMAQRSSQYLSVEEVAAKLSPALTAMRQIIISSMLVPEEKEKLLDNLSHALEEGIQKPLARARSAAAANAAKAPEALSLQVG
jgi:hypothetical protein